METAFLIDLLMYELLFFIAMNLLWIGLYYRFRKKERKTFSLKNRPLVSVIIPVFNKAKYLRKTINSVIGMSYKNKEIIVVNDGSTDESADICREYEKKGMIRFMDFRKNRGKSHVLNDAVKASRGNYILSIDADSFVSKSTIDNMIRHFDDPEMGAVAGVVKVLKKKGPLNMLQMIEYLQQAFQRLVQGFFNAVLVLPGPISLYSKSAIKSVGGFDDATLVEDWDMTMKIHKKGYKIVSEKGASAETVAPKSVKKWWHQRIRWSRGGIQIARRHTDLHSYSKNKALTRLIFPLHVMWLIVPWIVIPTFIALMVPETFAIQGIAASLASLFAMFQEAFIAGTSSIAQFFVAIDTVVFNVVDLTNLDMVRFTGYMSGVAFIWFTYTAIKSVEKRFTPKHLITLLLMPIYWMMLNFVYIESFIREVARGEMKW